MEMLPVRGPNESAEKFLDRLVPWMTRNLVAPQQPGTATIVDGQGRIIMSPAGSYSYVGDRLVVAPDIVKIDTTDLVDGAVELAKTNIPTLVLGNKVITGSEVVLSLLAGDVEAVKATIDNLEVNNANIANVSAGKLAAGTIGANGIYVGAGSKIHIDGVNTQIAVYDNQAAPVGRVFLGKVGTADTAYGIVIRDATGADVVTADGLGLHVVGTSQVKANAVTGPVSAYTNSQIGITHGATTTAQSATVTVTEPDSVVYVSFVCSAAIIAAAGGAATLQGFLSRGASGLVTGSNVAYAPPGGTSYQSVVISALDSPGAGTWTYSASLQTTGTAPTTCTAQARHLFAVELKR